MTRYLVTGATGFLGKHLVLALLEQGHEVVALARGEDADFAARGVTVKRGDILDAAKVLDAATGCGGVFHCAGKVSRKAEDAEELYRVHVEGTKNVVAACKKRGVRRLVVASTSGTVAVSDDPSKITNEDDETPIALVSRWPYYRAKLFAERAALEANGDDLEVVSVNPTLLLGPGDRRGSSTEDVRLFLEKKIPAVPGGGLSYVDVRDAALAMILAMERGVPGERYLLGACNVTMREFFGRLERVSGVRAPWIPLPRAPELIHASTGVLSRIAKRFDRELPIEPQSLDMSQYFWYLDATRAETTLGWSPRDPVATLADTVNDLRKRG